MSQAASSVYGAVDEKPVVFMFLLNTTTRRDGCRERFPITWNHVIDQESLEIKMVEQVLIEKVCQLSRNLLYV